MEEIDKLLDLFKAGEIELMWQLSKSLGIDGVELWTRLYNEFKDNEGDLKISPLIWIFYHTQDRMEEDYTYSLDVDNVFDYSDEDNYDKKLEPILLKLSKYLDGELR